MAEATVLTENATAGSRVKPKKLFTGRGVSRDGQAVKPKKTAYPPRTIR